MKSRINPKLIILSLVFIVLSSGAVSLAQPASVTVNLPVHGSLALPLGRILEEKLDVIDTYTGAIQVLAGAPGPNEFPVWDAQGEQIAYFSYGYHSTMKTVSTGTPQTIQTFAGHTGDEYFFPAGWSLDGTNLLYHGAIPGFPSTTHTFYLMDLGLGSLTMLLSYQSEQIVPNMPPPPGVTNFILISFIQVKRNPVYDKWVALELHARDVETTTTLDGGVPSIYVNVLWNYETGQMISLDSLFADPIVDSPVAWSQDGTYLSLMTFNRQLDQSTAQIVGFQNNGSIQVIDGANTNRRVEFWLGADNLLLAWSREETTRDRVYYIAEIIDSVWYETEFLRLSGEDFAIIKPGAWYIRASDTEKQTLSCLFDQAQPTRLAIGMRARVNFTSGTSLRLHAEPSLDAAEIQQMPEGTEFEVIGGSACVNSDSYYRFWQLQLDNGTTGWAAEADNTEYFIEPLPQVTPTDTPGETPAASPLMLLKTKD